MAIERIGEYNGFTRPVDLEVFAQPALHWAVANSITETAAEYRDEIFILRGGGASNWFIDLKKVLMHPY